ncbi:hypothetical protein EKO04_008303 [Ascochyta lentis]|uniref:Uncharacterized protein n=1 Tax=Ascochyta lentis TaxID=205686 RepID=A0A8H7IZB0_9PLEO|nr:hypothetical protein EKO04_008303 [Ascochyta lentis]
MRFLLAARCSVLAAHGSRLTAHGSLLRSGQGAGHMINIARGPQVVTMVPPQPLRRMLQLTVAQKERRASGESKGRETVPALDMGDGGGQTDAGRRPRPFRWDGSNSNSNSNRSEQRSRRLGMASALTTTLCRHSRPLIGRS